MTAATVWSFRPFRLVHKKAHVDLLGADGDVFPNYENILSQLLDMVQRAIFFYSMGLAATS